MSHEIALMAQCFAHLSKPRLQQLQLHADAMTPICCGSDAPALTNGAGGGCPAVLACSKIGEIPLKRIVLTEQYDWDHAAKDDPRAKQWMAVWVSMMHVSLEFPIRLAEATEEEVRAAIRLARLDSV